MIFTAYLDESGTHDGSDATVMGGFMGVFREEVILGRRLRALQHHYGFTIFHATEFKNRRGDFQGWSDEKGLALIQDMTDTVATSLSSVVIATLPNGRYRAEYRNTPRPGKVTLDSAYGLCFRMCLVHFLEEMEKRAPVRKYGSKLNVILEHGHPNAGDAKRIFEETRQNTMALYCADPLGTITTENKKSCARLMVADFLAYTGYMTDVQERAGVVIELGREDRLPSKASFTKLDFDPGVLEGLSDHFGGLRSKRRKAKGEAAARERKPQYEANRREPGG
jgi:Protein of unknown function (DUF3800)